MHIDGHDDGQSDQSGPSDFGDDESNDVAEEDGEDSYDTGKRDEDGSSAKRDGDGSSDSQVPIRKSLSGDLILLQNVLQQSENRIISSFDGRLQSVEQLAEDARSKMPLTYQSKLMRGLMRAWQKLMMTATALVPASVMPQELVAVMMIYTVGGPQYSGSRTVEASDLSLAALIPHSRSRRSWHGCRSTYSGPAMWLKGSMLPQQLFVVVPKRSLWWIWLLSTDLMRQLWSASSGPMIPMNPQRGHHHLGLI